MSKNKRRIALALAAVFLSASAAASASELIAPEKIVASANGTYYTASGVR